MDFAFAPVLPFVGVRRVLDKGQLVLREPRREGRVEGLELEPRTDVLRTVLAEHERVLRHQVDVVLGDGVRRNLVGVDNVTELRKGRRGVDARCFGVGVFGVAPRPERVRVVDLFRVGHLERQILERRVEPVVRVTHDAKRHAALVQRLGHVVVQVSLVQVGQVGDGRGVLAPVGNVELGLPARRGQAAYEELEKLLAGGLGDVDKGEAVFEGEEHRGLM